MANFRLEGFRPDSRVEFDLYITDLFTLLPTILQLGYEMGLDQRLTKYARKLGDNRALRK